MKFFDQKRPIKSLPAVMAASRETPCMCEGNLIDYNKIVLCYNEQISFV